MRVVTMVCYGKQPSNAESGPPHSGWLFLLVSDGRGGLVVRPRSGPCCRRIPGSKPNFTDPPLYPLSGIVRSLESTSSGIILI
ncbi:hypothetical protein AVEN_82246-1 [Araneus ventricosus]|uniref:Uncharacterized protein n=1 Tax=Araneus ventricosus TaxID=182803 RepID=A0A4Y2RES0_ARAVE|nr:hypothetical protein AVEN_82246-1 [Araneus ventricosus]